MACITADGSLTEQARAVLKALTPGRRVEEVAAQAGLPLYRVRSSVRELVQAGLVEETNAIYRTTAEGLARIA
jgi:predicted transcriptional regulator